MGYTKRQYIVGAFEEIGLASYAYDLSPEQLQSAKRRLDSMMAEWNGRGIRLGYPIDSDPANGDLDEQTYVPDFANEAIIANFAMRLAPMFGKATSPGTMAAAKGAYNMVCSRFAMPSEMQLPGTMPAGAGNKPYYTDSVFLTAPTDSLVVGGDAELSVD